MNSSLPNHKTALLLALCSPPACVDMRDADLDTETSEQHSSVDLPGVDALCSDWWTECKVHNYAYVFQIQPDDKHEINKYLEAIHSDIFLKNYYPTNNQEWYLKGAPGNTVRIMSASYDTCMRRTSTTHVEMAKCGIDEGDRWQFVPTPNRPPNFEYDYAAFGNYRLKNTANGRCLAGNNNLVDCTQGWEYYVFVPHTVYL